MLHPIQYPSQYFQGIEIMHIVQHH
jgi:hypothetical protein